MENPEEAPAVVAEIKPSAQNDLVEKQPEEAPKEVISVSKIIDD